MSEELYNSSDYCSLAEQYEELKKENAELTADKIHLIQAAMDGGDRYHYTAHDIGYRDLERKVKALEVDYIISNRELLILQVELARRDDLIKRLVEILPTLKISHHYCEDCWYSCPKHEDGCCNDAEGEDCNCGADTHNAKIDALMKELE